MRKIIHCLRALLVLATLIGATGACAASRVCIDSEILNFADRVVGSATTGTINVSNCGSALLTFTDVSVHPATAAGFQVAATCATGLVLAVGTSCTARITFAPQFPGQQSGGL